MPDHVEKWTVTREDREQSTHVHAAYHVNAALYSRLRTLQAAAPHSTDASHLGDLEQYEAELLGHHSHALELFRQSGAVYVQRIARFVDGLARTHPGVRTPTVADLLVFGRDIGDPGSGERRPQPFSRGRV